MVSGILGDSVCSFKNTFLQKTSGGQKFYGCRNFTTVFLLLRLHQQLTNMDVLLNTVFGMLLLMYVYKKLALNNYCTIGLCFIVIYSSSTGWIFAAGLKDPSETDADPPFLHLLVIWN